MRPRQIALKAEIAALGVAGLVAIAIFAMCYAAEPATEYVGRPIYSDPTNGLQLPPHCAIEPTWRSRVPGTEMEVWVLNCDAVARAWLLMRQVVDTHDSRLRFQVLDERVLPGQTAGDSLSVQCAAASDTPGTIIYGARWRSSGRELRLDSASGAFSVDIARRRLVTADPKGIDCVRFPDREAMMRKLQQTEGATK